jgi:hypothetical protein
MDPASGGSPPFECTSSYNLHMQQAAPQRRVNSEGELLGHHRDDGVNYTMPLTGFIRRAVTPKQISYIHIYFSFQNTNQLKTIYTHHKEEECSLKAPVRFQ